MLISWMWPLLGDLMESDLPRPKTQSYESVFAALSLYTQETT